MLIELFQQKEPPDALIFPWNSPRAYKCSGNSIPIAKYRTDRNRLRCVKRDFRASHQIHRNGAGSTRIAGWNTKRARRRRASSKILFSRKKIHKKSAKCKTNNERRHWYETSKVAPVHPYRASGSNRHYRDSGLDAVAGFGQGASQGGKHNMHVQSEIIWPL